MKRVYTHSNKLSSALSEFVANRDNINAICAKHGVNRMAFYRYKDKSKMYYNVDFDKISKTSKNKLQSFIVLLKHIQELRASECSILNNAGIELENMLKDMLLRSLRN